nr:hypothetical protein [uncultured Mediterranean phage uvMED]
MRQIDRLLALAGQNNSLTKCECIMDDGSDFSFYVKPLTMAQVNECQKPSKKGDEITTTESAVKLFVLRALDQNGTRQYALADIPFLMGLPSGILNKVIGVMNAIDDEEVEISEAGEPLDMKSNKKEAKG